MSWEQAGEDIVTADLGDLPTDHEADLTGVTNWVFDLDNTLYPVESQFMRLIEKRINDYVVRTSGLPADEALVMQKSFLHDYGTSLAGLMTRYQIDPYHFLAEVHDVPLDVLAPDQALRLGLERLNGRRVIFTNGSSVHAHRVMDKLGLTDLFDGVFALEDADLIPKPDPRTFEKMLTKFGIDPTTACFFEDTPQNLAPAKAIGMKTVLVGPKAFSAEGDYIDYRAASLAPFLATAILDGDPQ
ncbi:MULTISPECIES: pyrimidine 5'-nucleotidase [unclassified Brevundimonas]|uniref:pyrimidine 5'-nucleotidase n=1 Tax=unclassified Brevundimonas TaxID=2622653 RepID=UPI0025C59134|nr:MULTISPECIES: pyrimidine 5'-nucleotidase [unclassified Brevundimonas]